jgi:hypothetical protein
MTGPRTRAAGPGRGGSLLLMTLAAIMVAVLVIALSTALGID